MRLKQIFVWLPLLLVATPAQAGVWYVLLERYDGLLLADAASLELSENRGTYDIFTGFGEEQGAASAVHYQAANVTVDCQSKTIFYNRVSQYGRNRDLMREQTGTGEPVPVNFDSEESQIYLFLCGNTDNRRRGVLDDPFEMSDLYFRMR